MHVLFLLSLVAGLLVGVLAMLHGVERPSPAGSAGPIVGAAVADAPPPPAPRARLSRPTVAGFATVFGAVGYLLLRYSSLSPVWTLVLAAVAGAAGASAAVALVAWWALRGAPLESDDPHHLIQGHPARVTAPIGADAPGEITFELQGGRHVVRARSIDGAPVAVGDEVVIERIENDVAYVESWSVVESRL
ncbi:MAG TPA: hypothetical protein VFJ74_15795 [Gemmatimonadaceae bacterium]|nr:hypothetical protein [Gemmatimonadaceae bacterium]